MRAFPHIWDGKKCSFGVRAQGQKRVQVGWVGEHMRSQTEEEIKERPESPSSFLCCIFGRARQSWPVTFQSVCSLSCPEIPDKRNHGMRSEEPGSHPQDIPPTLTLFQGSILPDICQGPAALRALASGAGRVGWAGGCGEGVPPKQPSPPARCLSHCCLGPEIPPRSTVPSVPQLSHIKDGCPRKGNSLLVDAFLDFS